MHTRTHTLTINLRSCIVSWIRLRIFDKIRMPSWLWTLLNYKKNKNRKQNRRIKNLKLIKKSNSLLLILVRRLNLLVLVVDSSPVVPVHLVDMVLLIQVHHQIRCQLLQLLHSPPHYQVLLRWVLMIVNQLVAEVDCKVDSHTDRIDWLQMVD